LELHFKNLVIIIIIIYYFCFFETPIKPLPLLQELKNQYTRYKYICSFITPTSNFQVPQRALTHVDISTDNDACFTSTENFPSFISLKDKNQKSKLKKRVLENFPSSNLIDTHPIYPSSQKTKKKEKNSRSRHTPNKG